MQPSSLNAVSVQTPFRKFAHGADLGGEEVEALKSVLVSPTSYDAGETIQRVGDKPDSSIVLIDGMAMRTIELTSGGRQIVTIGVPGDWVDLQSYFIRTMDHSLIALSRCTIIRIPHTRVKSLIETYPRIMQALWRDVTIDAGITRMWVANVGGRDAVRAVAHLFCELRERLDAVGLLEGDGYVLRMTQAELGEAVGISPVHANRVMQRLRGLGLVEFGQGRVSSPDWGAVRDLADFDPTYLHLDEGPSIPA